MQTMKDANEGSNLALKPDVPNMGINGPTNRTELFFLKENPKSQDPLLIMTVTSFLLAMSISTKSFNSTSGHYIGR